MNNKLILQAILKKDIPCYEVCELHIKQLPDVVVGVSNVEFVVGRYSFSFEPYGRFAFSWVNKDKIYFQIDTSSEVKRSSMSIPIYEWENKWAEIIRDAVHKLNETLATKLEYVTIRETRLYGKVIRSDVINNKNDSEETIE